MKQTRIDKQVLRNIIVENRQHHEQIFQEALDGYKKKCLSLLQEHIADIEAGRVKAVQVREEQPNSHLRDYDRLLRQLDLEVDDTVVLTDREFAEYVQDDWSWRREFLAKNATYSTTAGAEYAEME